MAGVNGPLKAMSDAMPLFCTVLNVNVAAPPRAVKAPIISQGRNRLKFEDSTATLRQKRIKKSLKKENKRVHLI